MFYFLYWYAKLIIFYYNNFFLLKFILLLLLLLKMYFRPIIVITKNMFNFALTHPYAHIYTHTYTHTHTLKHTHAHTHTHTHTIDWCGLFSLTDNVDIAWNNFINLFQALILKFTPLKQASNSGHVSLLPPNIFWLIKYKRFPWRNYNKNKCAKNGKMFYRLTKTMRSSINVFRKAHKENILVSDSMKKFFN